MSDAKPVDLAAIRSRHAETAQIKYETKPGWNNGGCPSRFLIIKGLGAYELPEAEAVFFAASHDDVPDMADEIEALRDGLREAMSGLMLNREQSARLRALLPPEEPAKKPTPEDVEAWGREFEASAVMIKIPRS